MIELREYQQNGINEILSKIYENKTRIVYQLPTGGGKTVTFAGLNQAFLKKYYNSNILIIVHRIELLNQCKRTLTKFGIHSETIVASKKNLEKSSVYIAMVETLFIRIKSNPDYLKNIGLVIVDEVHMANFNKIYDYFQTAIIVGFSATPLASNKKFPLKNYFQDIVIGPTIEELIKMKYLVTNMTYGLKGIDRKKIGMKNGDFDNYQMGSMFSKGRNLKNTITAYQKFCYDEKTLVFNCNIDHSKKMNNEFQLHGCNSRHLDGSFSDEERLKTLKWFSETDNAILNSVGILTMGFDEPSIRNVIVNRSTMSLPLWLQMCGRGGRTYQNKPLFKIIDMGGNATYHGDWNAEIDWRNLFFNPDKPKMASGVSPVKTCKNCEALIPAQAVTCEFCGYVHERIIEYDKIIPKFELITSRIDVREIFIRNIHAKEWKTFFDILNKTIALVKYNIELDAIDDKIINDTFSIFEIHVKQWRSLCKLPYSKNIKEFAYTKYKSEMLNLKNKSQNIF